MSKLTPTEIIYNAQKRIDAAQSHDELAVAWDQGLGALYALMDLGLIDVSTWRWHHGNFDSRAELRTLALEQGGVQ